MILWPSTSVQLEAWQDVFVRLQTSDLVNQVASQGTLRPGINNSSYIIKLAWCSVTAVIMYYVYSHLWKISDFKYFLFRWYQAWMIRSTIQLLLINANILDSVIALLHMFLDLFGWIAVLLLHFDNSWRPLNEVVGLPGCGEIVSLDCVAQTIWQLGCKYAYLSLRVMQITAVSW